MKVYVFTYAGMCIFRRVLFMHLHVHSRANLLTEKNIYAGFPVSIKWKWICTSHYENFSCTSKTITCVAHSFNVFLCRVVYVMHLFLIFFFFWKCFKFYHTIPEKRNSGPVNLAVLPAKRVSAIVSRNIRLILCSALCGGRPGTNP